LKNAIIWLMFRPAADEVFLRNQIIYG
jgi:hypothetical protein